MRLRDLMCRTAFFSREMIQVRSLSWSPLVAFGALILLLSAPRFGQAGVPDSKGLLAATHLPVAQPRLAIHLSQEAASPAPSDVLERFADALDTHGIVDVVLPGETAAAAYDVELGLRRGAGRGEQGQLRIRVLSRDRQVLLAFRAPLSDRQKAFDESAGRLARWFEGKQWRSSVASLDAGRITIYGGSRHQLEPGLELSAVARQPVYDDAGRPLGHASTPIGRLRLVEVGERTAVAKILSGCEQLSPGTEVVLAHTAP